MSSIDFDPLYKEKHISPDRLRNYEKYIEIIAKSLNEINNVNYKTRYWEIIVGPWLIYFIWFLDYKYLKLKNSEDFTVKQKHILVPYDYTSFAWSINTGNE